MADTNEPHLIPIGAVTRMTGINGHTLRKWESRYGLVVPTRSDTGRRLYSQDDVERLLLVRDLLDAGFQPSQLADLDEAALRALHRPKAPARRRTGRATPTEVLAVGHVIGATLRLAGDAPLADTRVRYYAGGVEDWLAQPGADGSAVLLECPSLQPPLAKRILDRRRADAGPTVIVYGFASNVTLGTLTEAGMVCLKAPAGPQELAAALGVTRTAGERLEAAAEQPPAPRRYSDAQIALLAGAIPAIECECPTHVAQLLMNIGAFERYSSECGDADPVQRELHRYLQRVAGAARCLFENAMTRVAEVEGIELDG